MNPDNHITEGPHVRIHHHSHRRISNTVHGGWQSLTPHQRHHNWAINPDGMSQHLVDQLVIDPVSGGKPELCIGVTFSRSRSRGTAR